MKIVKKEGHPESEKSKKEEKQHSDSDSEKGKAAEKSRDLIFLCHIISKASSSATKGQKDVYKKSWCVLEIILVPE